VSSVSYDSDGIYSPAIVIPSSGSDDSLPTEREGELEATH
jgi:hypothetical protein